jgi:hypothetical protein
MPTSRTFLALSALALAALAPTRASATCGPTPYIQLELRLPDCEAAPAGVWPAELPLTFTYARGTTCCAGPQSCTTLWTSVSAEQLALDTIQLREALAAPLTRGDQPRGVAATGQMCGELALMTITGGPLPAATYSLNGAAVEVKRGAIDAGSLKHYETLAAFGAKPSHPPLPKPKRDQPMGADGSLDAPRRWWVW